MERLLIAPLNGKRMCNYLIYTIIIQHDGVLYCCIVIVCV
jgi:hypothetical protein